MPGSGHLVSNYLLMIKKLLLVSTLALGVCGAKAQTKFSAFAGLAIPSISSSVKAQMDYLNVSQSGSVNLNTSPLLGLSLEQGLSATNHRLLGDVSLLWSQLSYANVGSANQITLPLAIRYHVSNAIPLSFGAGGYASYLFGDGDGETDYGLLFRARYDIQKFYIQADYLLGLKNFNQFEENDIWGGGHASLDVSARMRSFRIGVGYTF